MEYAVPVFVKIMEYVDLRQRVAEVWQSTKIYTKYIW